MLLTHLEVGKRAKVISLGIKGTIEFVDRSNLVNHHLNPVQLVLDQPHTEHSDSVTYRTSVLDLKTVKKGRRKR